MLDGRRRVLIQDEIEADRPVEATWCMHTAADVATTGSLARLEQKGKRLMAQILEPSGAQFQVIAADAPPPNHANPGIRKLVIQTPGKKRDWRIRVLFTPMSQELESAFSPELIPLAEWSSRLPQ